MLKECWKCWKICWNIAFSGVSFPQKYMFPTFSTAFSTLRIIIRLVFDTLHHSDEFLRKDLVIKRIDFFRAHFNVFSHNLHKNRLLYKRTQERVPIPQSFYMQACYPAGLSGENHIKDRHKLFTPTAYGTPNNPISWSSALSLPLDRATFFLCICTWNMSGNKV